MSKVGFAYLTPILCVDNLAKSLEHYEKVLGFEISWQWSDDEGFGKGEPHFACVCRGEIALFLGQQRQGNPGTWISFFVKSLDEVEALYQEYQASGAKIVAPPKDFPWGMREMLVEDLDGNSFRIGCQLDKG